MIQANELRIGNYIIRANGFPSAVSAYDFEHTNFQETNPIPITPEILEKCGFDLTQWFCEGSYKIREDKSDMLYGWTFVVRNANHDREIEFGYFKYVHELQNLYFALTGEELEIEL